VKGAIYDYQLVEKLSGVGEWTEKKAIFYKREGLVEPRLIHLSLHGASIRI
jgi:hypothetical protein